MHTQNVNVAASEAPKTWLNTPEQSRLRGCFKLAELEGSLMMHVALRRMGLDYSGDECHMIRVVESAACLVSDMLEDWELNTPAVYDMAKNVEALGRSLLAENWDLHSPVAL